MDTNAPPSDTIGNTNPHRIVLVTGAGTGIGRATARAFAAQGAHVVAVGRREAPLAETAAYDETRITPLAVDITAEDGPETIVRAARERYGRLDALVNNAAIVNAESLRTYTRGSAHARLQRRTCSPPCCSPRPRSRRWRRAAVSSST
ncbi:hypothetical protein SALBM311S_06827 [Streptomyces alboniger]